MAASRGRVDARRYAEIARLLAESLGLDKT
jgi:hypothetical protein